MRRPYFILFAVLFCLCAPRRAQAASMPCYRLDSLVYLSSDIVEADVVSTSEKHHLVNVTARISHVYRGTSKVGDKIDTVGLGDYYLNDPYAAVPKYVQSNMHLVLFMNPHGDLYNPVSSGVKLVEKGTVYGFWQCANPGPFSLNRESPEGFDPPASLDSFRRTLESTIQQVDAIRPLLAKQPEPADLPSLLDILRKQRSSFWSNFSGIGNRAQVQIGKLHDDNALVDVLALDYNFPLTYHFANPRGRDFLFKIVTDTTQSDARRIGCAKALPFTYGYDWGAPAPKSDDWIARLIELASRCRANDPVTVAVLDSLDNLANRPDCRELLPQIGANLGVLQQIYAAGSESSKFQVEKLLIDGGENKACQALSPCGPITSIVQADQASPLQIKVRLVRDNTIRNRKDIQQQFVLTNTETNRQFSFPPGKRLQSYIGRNEENFTTVAPSLPNLPHGHYRLFLEYKQGDEVISQGHYCELEL